MRHSVQEKRDDDLTVEFQECVVDELLPPHLHRGDVGAGVVHGLIAKTPTEVFEKG